MKKLTPLVALGGLLLLDAIVWTSVHAGISPTIEHPRYPMIVANLTVSVVNLCVAIVFLVATIANVARVGRRQ